MRITLRLTGGIAHKAGFSRRELEVEPGTRVRDVLDTMAIDRTWPMVIARNGWAVEPDETLEPGDRLFIAPVFSGG